MYYTNILFIVLLLMLLFSAFFAASEIGMMSLNRYRLRYLVKKKNKQAIRVSKLLMRTDRLLSVVLIGNTIGNIVASTVATLLGQELYGSSGVAIATLILSFVVLIFAEMLPKTLAAMYPEKVAFFSAVPLQIFQIMLAPAVKFMSWTTSWLLFLLRIPVHLANKDILTGEELRTVVHESGSLLPTEQKSMLLSLLDLERGTVEDIMVPKIEIIGIDIDGKWKDVLETFETVQHTRLPIYRTTIENLVGIVHLRDVLSLKLSDNLNKESLLDIIESPYFIPEATPLNVQLLNFQQMKRRCSFVVDEYGDLLGLVTMEDILEEVVGEFTTDIANLSKDITPQVDGTFVVDGSMTIRNLNRLMSWQLPLIGPRTVSGLVIEYLGFIPPSNCCLQIESYKIEILKVSDNTVKTLRIWKSNTHRVNIDEDQS